MSGKTKKLKVLPIDDRPNLFGLLSDTKHQTWTIKRLDGRGKVHAIAWPWERWGHRFVSNCTPPFDKPKKTWMSYPPLTCCQYRVWAGVEKYEVEWLDAKRLTCRACRVLPSLPLEGIWPESFPPPVDLDDLRLAADWWDERGEEYRARTLRLELERPRPTTKTEGQYANGAT